MEYFDVLSMQAAKSYLTTHRLRLEDPGPNGATRTANALRKCKHAYCQYAAIAFDVGSALFGGKKSSAEMLQTVKAQAGETYTDDAMVTEFGTMTMRTEAGN